LRRANISGLNLLGVNANSEMELVTHYWFKNGGMSWGISTLLDVRSPPAKFQKVLTHRNWRW
jgi:hypothetical protein